jgi:hypothetical protein
MRLLLSTVGSIPKLRSERHGGFRARLPASPPLHVGCLEAYGEILHRVLDRVRGLSPIITRPGLQNLYGAQKIPLGYRSPCLRPIAGPSASPLTSLEEAQKLVMFLGAESTLFYKAGMG